MPGHCTSRILFIALLAVLIFFGFFLCAPFEPDTLLRINGCLYFLAILISLWLVRTTMALPRAEVRNALYRKTIAGNMRYLRKSAVFWNVVALVGSIPALVIHLPVSEANEPQEDHAMFICQEFALCISCALISYAILYGIVNLRSVVKLKKVIGRRLIREKVQRSNKQSELGGKAADAIDN